MVVTINYEESDKEEELQTVSVVINNNYINVVSDSDSDESEDDSENNIDNRFW